VAVERAVLGEAPPTARALVGLLARVVADMAHQGALLPEAPQTELAHEGLVLRVGAQVHLQRVLNIHTHTHLLDNDLGGGVQTMVGGKSSV